MASSANGGANGGAEGQRCWRVAAAGLVIRVRVTPKSSRDEVGALVDTADGPALAVKVRAVPADGAANTAVALALANWLGLPKSAVAMTAGAKSRIKSVTLSGDAAALEKLVDAKLRD
jgi:uncharacterized protein